MAKSPSSPSGAASAPASAKDAKPAAKAGVVRLAVLESGVCREWQGDDALVEIPKALASCSWLRLSATRPSRIRAPIYSSIFDFALAFISALGFWRSERNQWDVPRSDPGFSMIQQ